MSIIAAIEARLGPGWSVEGELGTGATSRVYLASHEDGRQRVVVKVMRAGAAMQDRAHQFLLEMRLLQQLAHPHVVPILEAGEARDVLYFIMPYVEGETLRQRLHRAGPLPVAEAVRVGRDIADALNHVHSAGIVHRDVKPDNILLSDRGAILLDFGHARAPGAASAATGADGKRYIVGTPGYVSPEQVAGKRVEDARSDLYSLGCVLFEMLTGAPPFTSGSSQQVMKRRLAEVPPDLRTVRADVPEDVAIVARRALAIDPAERYVTASVMRDALDSALGAASAA